MLRVASTCCMAKTRPLLMLKMARQSPVCLRTPLSSTRFLSSARPAPAPPKKAGYSIPAQGVLFSILLFPVLGYAMFAGRYGPSEEELEQEIRARYGAKVDMSRQKNSNMAEFFKHTIHQPDGKYDDKLQEVLHAGKGRKKRMHAVDQELYGTAEGVAEQKRQEEERKHQQEQRRKKKAGEIVQEANKSASETKKNDAPQQLPPSSANNGGLVVNAQSAAAVGAVAVLAAGVGFLAGGARRS